MQYFISLLEGMITFISPCLLPMLPVYVSYFAGGGERKAKTTFINAMGFVLGFTLKFVAMGAFAGTFGSFFKSHAAAVNVITGLVVICFGLHYIGVFKLSVFRGIRGKIKMEGAGFFSAMLLGIVFSVGWTPCVGAFLGSALMQASQQGTVGTGIIMLLCYSLGLGIPFLISAVLIDKLKGAFDFVKHHYGVINAFCGGFLILMGVLMATGTYGRFLSIISGGGV